MSDGPVTTLPVVDDLTLGDCPLLEDTPATQAIVASYRQAKQQYELFFKAFKQDLAEDEPLIELGRKLRKIRKDLSTPHYSIGFVGPTQNGKSTAVNYVLDAVIPADQPSKEGANDNTTSTTARIRHGERGLELRYMTLDQYQQKKAELCKASGPDFNSESSEEDLLKRISGRLAEVQRGEAPNLENGREILEHDVRKLEQLLKAFQMNAMQTADKSILGTRWNVAYEKREMYLNYVENPHPLNPLLQEAKITFDSKFHPPELELFDLPGPGAKTTIDEWTTRQYLPQMNGVMLFVDVKVLGDEVVERLYNQLRSHFKTRAHKRVWVILTRWDGPQYAGLIGDGKNTVFRAIHTFMAEKKLQPSQVRFTCSPWYRSSDDKPAQHFKDILRSDSPYPKTLDDYPELRPLFDDLLVKGGIPSLRRLVLEDIPRDVRAEILETSDEGLKQIRRDLKRRFDHEVRKRTASREDSTKANECEVQLQQLIIRMKRELAPYESGAINLRNDLRETFNKNCPPDEVLDEFNEVPKKFPVHTRILEDRLLSQVQMSVIPTLYQHWLPHFDALPDLGILESLEGDALLNAGQIWRMYADEDERLPDIGNGQFPTFLDARLFASGDDPDAEIQLAKGATYRRMMMEKISLAAQQAVHSVRNRLIERGLGIKRELDQLVRKDGTPPVGAGEYEALQKIMGDLAG